MINKVNGSGAMLMMYSCFNFYSIELSGFLEIETGNSCSPLNSCLPIKSCQVIVDKAPWCAVVNVSCYTKIDATHLLGGFFLFCF